MSENNLAELDPENVLAMVTAAVRDAAIKADNQFPDYREMSEEELEQKINPSINATLIRVAFWEEYNKAKFAKRRMMMSKIYEGVFTKDNFYKSLDNPKFVIWMMTPPASEMILMKADTYKARQEYSKILRTGLIDKYGKVKLKEAKLSVEIYKIYSDRIHGAVMQRIEQKVQHIPMPEDIEGSGDEVRQKIKELEAMQIDVTKTDKG